MEKRSRRRTRDLVTQPAIQGLSENEIGCARISMMARSKTAPFKGRIQKRKTKRLHSSHLACNTRPVHTVGSFATHVWLPYVRYASLSDIPKVRQVVPPNVVERNVRRSILHPRQIKSLRRGDLAAARTVAGGERVGKLL